MTLKLNDDDTALSIARDDLELLRYVYRPDNDQFESPRPYFEPIRDLAGLQVSLYRPHDHVWHKGIALSLPNCGPENFWGGRTFRRGQGYVDEKNDGSMEHRAFTELTTGEQQPMDDERIETKWFEASEVDDMIRDRRVQDGKTIVGFLTWQRYCHRG